MIFLPQSFADSKPFYQVRWLLNRWIKILEAAIGMAPGDMLFVQSSGAIKKLRSGFPAR